MFSILTMGSSVFFWNCTRRTRVTFSNSGSTSSSSSTGGTVLRPLTGGGDARRDSSPYTSRATTSWAWSRAWKKMKAIIIYKKTFQMTRRFTLRGFNYFSYLNNLNNVTSTSRIYIVLKRLAKSKKLTIFKHMNL